MPPELPLWTVTVTVAVTEAALLVAVSVYVVVVVGATMIDPFAAVELAPTGEIVTEVAPLVVQLSVSEAPVATMLLLAVNALMVGGGGGVTVIVTDAVTEPALLVAVSV